MTPIHAAALAAISGIAHGFFGRTGGVSGGIYGSLNCGFGSNDDRAAVRENRRRIAASFGRDFHDLLTVHQIHSARAVTVETPWVPGGPAPEADAMVTDRPGVVLGVLAADCAPVLFADRERGVIGAAHAGWKGAFTGVLEATVAAMEALGARRGAIHAALGPCIGPQSYEVGPEFQARFMDVDPAKARWFAPSAERDGHFMFDLPGYVLFRLGALGLGAVDSAHHDTRTNPERFFSYRRATLAQEVDYGRQISAIVRL